MNMKMRTPNDIPPALSLSTIVDVIVVVVERLPADGVTIEVEDDVDAIVVVFVNCDVVTTIDVVTLLLGNGDEENRVDALMAVVLGEGEE